MKKKLVGCIHESESKNEKKTYFVLVKAILPGKLVQNSFGSKLAFVIFFTFARCERTLSHVSSEHVNNKL